MWGQRELLCSAPQHCSNIAHVAPHPHACCREKSWHLVLQTHMLLEMRHIQGPGPHNQGGMGNQS